MKQTTEKTRLLFATGFCFFYYFAQSVARGVYGTLSPFLIEHYDKSLTESSLFNMAENIGFITIMLLVTLIADRIDKAWLMGGLGTIYTVILLFMGRGPSFTLFLVMLFITGMLGRYMDTTCTAYISDLYGERRNQYMSLLLIMFYIGSTLAPNLNTLVIEVWGKQWYLSYLISGLLMGVGTVLYFVYMGVIKKPVLAIDAPKQTDDAPQQQRLGIFQLLRNRNILVLFISNIVTSISGYFGMQLILYLSMLDPVTYDTATRGFIATAGSIGMTLGSALYVWISRRMRADRYLCMEILVAAIFSLAGIIINNPIVWMVLRFLSSAIGGGAFTARTLLCCEEFPQQSSSAIAVVSMAGGIASIFTTPLLNMLAEATTLNFAMFFSLSFTFLSWGLIRFGYKPHTAS